jgi:DNA-directed RNA polymerase subunit RPC12/RpoP
MLDLSDPSLYELRSPGAITGETEISCPHCLALLTVPVNDPGGKNSYRCCKCRKVLRTTGAVGRKPYKIA